MIKKMLPPGWSKNLVVYEVNLRQYTAGGTFREFSDHLPRLAELGVGILWFMPVQPVGVLNRKGTLGSYYSISDYMAVDPAYGTLEEFRDMVDRIHSLGMFVLLDWVANHTSWDNVLTKSHPEFYRHNEAGDVFPPIDEWSDVIGLDYTNPDLREYMIGAMQFWLMETGIDGFRCDMANLVPVDFWEEARSRLDETKPVFMLAEAEQHEMLNYAFDSIYNWNLLHLMNGMAQSERSVADLDAMLNIEISEFPKDSYQLLFTSNHDENSWNGSEIERLHFGLEAYTVLAFTLTGMPLIYSGQEAGNYRRLSFFDKDMIDWKKDKMFGLFQRLNYLKRTSPALWSGPFGGDFTRLSSASSDVFAFSRSKDENHIVVVINFSAKSQHSELAGMPLGNYIDFFNGGHAALCNGMSLYLQPWEYRIYRAVS
ncbi:MAG: alpha-amylase family glycosyl hydrolase [Bacteroidales bacterium]